MPNESIPPPLGAGQYDQGITRKGISQKPPPKEIAPISKIHGLNLPKRSPPIREQFRSVFQSGAPKPKI